MISTSVILFLSPSHSSSHKCRGQPALITLTHTRTVVLSFHVFSSFQLSSVSVSESAGSVSISPAKLTHHLQVAKISGMSRSTKIDTALSQRLSSANKIGQDCLPKEYSTHALQHGRMKNTLELC